uniref:Uncharacterized protein n=1 Tax=Spongospora subterranea TaxID=70186 RepID=A0A0H5RBF7_9EUKA|eukprot:CRZ10957.1 hypothetical protein [Spongospora subterranea]
MLSLKLTAIGDGSVGKTCLLISYTSNTFPEDYSPTVFDSYETHIDLSGSKIHLSLTDTAGQEDYDKLRPLSYHSTDAFILCFSVANHPSFINITQKWIPELKQHKQLDVPFILVATKVDLREQAHLKLIGEPEGRALAKKIGAYGYVECSAKTQTGLHEVFKLAAEAARNKKKKSKRCSIL